jgi:hypothetical protein
MGITGASVGSRFGIAIFWLDCQRIDCLPVSEMLAGGVGKAEAEAHTVAVELSKIKYYPVDNAF